MPGELEPTSRHIVLTGPMGAGKTTVGRELANRLGRPFIDSDAEIEQKHRATARLLAEERGVDWLHGIEAAVLDKALDSADPVVIAAAASVGEHPRLHDLFPDRRVILVLLVGEPSVLAARAAPGLHRRSVTVEEYRQITQNRLRRLDPLADFKIDVTAYTRQEVLDGILRNCFGAPPGISPGREKP